MIAIAPPENIGTGNAKGRCFSPPNSAFVRFEAGTLNEDWLVTPVVDLTNYSGTSLTFYAGQAYTDPYQTVYKVKVSTSSQTNIASFVDLQTYGEVDFTGSGNSPLVNLTAQKIISLASYSGQQIYIAFVMIQDDGDNWSLDNVAVTGTLGTTTFDGANKISVFPNPTGGLLSINSSTAFDKSSLFDLLGKQVKSFGTKTDLDISDLNTGVYLLKITSADGSDQFLLIV